MSYRDPETTPSPPPQQQDRQQSKRQQPSRLQPPPHSRRRQLNSRAQQRPSPSSNHTGSDTNDAGSSSSGSGSGGATANTNANEYKQDLQDLQEEEEEEEEEWELRHILNPPLLLLPPAAAPGGAPHRRASAGPSSPSSPPAAAVEGQVTASLAADADFGAAAAMVSYGPVPGPPMVEVARGELPSLLPREIAILSEAATGTVSCSIETEGSSSSQFGGSSSSNRTSLPAARAGHVGGVSGPMDAAAAVQRWLEAVEDRLIECAESIDPSDAVRLLACLAALHRTPTRSCVRLLVAVAGQGFTGWRWRGCSSSSSLQQQQSVQQSPSAGSNRSVGVDGGRGEGLSEPQLRTLLLAVSAVDGAYPGEPWLADWCTAYRKHIVGGRGEGVTHGSTEGDGCDEEAATTASVAEILYCLATLQFVPPEDWEAAALAAVQPGLDPWLALAAELQPSTAEWALAPEPLPQLQPLQPQVEVGPAGSVTCRTCGAAAAADVGAAGLGGGSPGGSLPAAAGAAVHCWQRRSRGDGSRRPAATDARAPAAGVWSCAGGGDVMGLRRKCKRSCSGGAGGRT
ncbi:hypothetical protein VOLCADRAFT_100196 [Volvox carteri f. nagariensis]|uniref:Uncharacterized protein n=1 Tax=Volvox carteri f. nagariensis TaxID=3068 RepID=D8UJN3_VOLCA|nr:uncharacterized protein VOLCADRAFT_100196 [Volvox carteri f. nagariensis]EFJ40067.1 hypothetical protein VOLCADRAFT_100196 [Volvox carteri f. nagariensis]|eukprot:XP_002958879.1 hypothetical protein VOLCADRAFT_100196 [Volvox carteri f. nagariensis]